MELFSVLQNLSGVLPHSQGGASAVSQTSSFSSLLQRSESDLFSVSLKQAEMSAVSSGTATQMPLKPHPAEGSAAGELLDAALFPALQRGIPAEAEKLSQLVSQMSGRLQEAENGTLPASLRETPNQGKKAQPEKKSALMDSEPTNLFSPELIGSQEAGSVFSLPEAEDIQISDLGGPQEDGSTLKTAAYQGVAEGRANASSGAEVNNPPVVANGVSQEAPAFRNISSVEGVLDVPSEPSGPIVGEQGLTAENTVADTVSVLTSSGADEKDEASRITVAAEHVTAGSADKAKNVAPSSVPPEEGVEVPAPPKGASGAERFTEEAVNAVQKAAVNSSSTSSAEKASLPSIAQPGPVVSAAPSPSELRQWGADPSVISAVPVSDTQSKGTAQRPAGAIGIENGPVRMVDESEGGALTQEKEAAVLKPVWAQMLNENTGSENKSKPVVEQVSANTNSPAEGLRPNAERAAGEMAASQLERSHPMPLRHEGGAGSQPVESVGMGNVGASTPQPGQSVTSSPVVSATMSSAATSHHLFEAQVADQVISRVALRQDGDKSTMIMKLHPEDLGEVRLDMSIENSRVHVHLVTSTSQAQEALENQLSRLREGFEQQGLKLEEIRVAVDSGRDGQQSFQRGEQQSQGGQQNMGRHSGFRQTGHNEPQQSAEPGRASHGGLSMRV